MLAKIKITDRFDIKAQSDKAEEYIKPRIEIIESSRVSKTVLHFFGGGISLSKMDEIEVIEENAGNEEDFDAEYFVSLNKLHETDEWVIWGSNGLRPTKRIKFWIIFHESLYAIATETMKKLGTVFETYYYDSELNFTNELEQIFRELETR